MLFILFTLIAGGFVGSEKPVEKEFVPAWAKSVVWYQIFPERFRNGDPTNDPPGSYANLSWPFDNQSPWQIHPWTSDWYELQPYEQQNKLDRNANIVRRRYGGDLQGIIDKLAYLQDLGITALYLNPVFMAPSHHKYDGMMYHHIDPYLGPDPAGDLKRMETENPADPNTWVWTSADKMVLRLIEEAHRRGMRLIFDGVFNHMGINSFAFQDVKKHQQKSAYKDWFTIKSWDNPKAKTKFEYEGWFGVKELPELREDENGIVSGPKEYIFASTRRWMDPNGDGSVGDGIDGWRLDVAFCISHPFWKDWRKLVKSINPDAYITAEIIDSIEATRPYLLGDEFDAVMNYNFAFLSSDYFIDIPNRISTTEFDAGLKKLRDSFTGGVTGVQQNLFGSHDTNRLSSAIVNKNLGGYGQWGDYFMKSKASSNPGYLTTKPTVADYQIQKLFVIFQMTYPGAPMVYYGDEVGMWGANDPDCRKPMVWADLSYAPEVYNYDGSKRTKPETVEVNQDLLAHYKKLIGIRNAHPALSTGDFKAILCDNLQQVYVYSRTLSNETILVVLNNSETAATIHLTAAGIWKDVLNGDDFSALTGLTIPGTWGRILIKK